MTKERVRITNNGTAAASFAVGMLGIDIPPGDGSQCTERINRNMITVAQWAAIKNSEAGKALIAKGVLVGPEVPADVVPEKTTAELMTEARTAKEAGTEAKKAKAKAEAEAKVKAEAEAEAKAKAETEAEAKAKAEAAAKVKAEGKKKPESGTDVSL